MVPTHCLHPQREGLNKQFDLLSEKLKRLRFAFAVETDVTIKFKLEKQIEETLRELADTEAQLNALEDEFELSQKVTNVAHSQTLHAPGNRSHFHLISNRILFALSAAISFICVLYLFLPIAESVLAIIGMLTTFVVFLFPSLKRIHQQKWFQGWLATLVLGAYIVMLVGICTYFHQTQEDLRVTRLDGTDENGLCGIHCSVTLEGQGVSNLTAGQRLTVYGPQSRLIGGTWAEAPIAIVRVLGVDKQIAFAQVLLVHESANLDDNRRLKAGLRVLTESEVVTDFLVPVFGDGYVYQGYVVYLKPGTTAKVGNRLVTMKPQIQGQRIIDHLAGNTELQIVALGQEGISAKTVLVSGPVPTDGDIVMLRSTPDSPLLPYEPQMVFIPSATYTMGSYLGDTDEYPVASVTIRDIYVSVYETTNAQFRPFIENGGYRNSTYWTSQGWDWVTSEGISEPKYWTDSLYYDDKQPIVGVSWYEAVAYANWLSRKTGRTYRLPTEAEWERTACGIPNRQYAWGDTWDGALANFADRALGESVDSITWADNNFDDGYVYTAPVGSYLNGSSPEGIFDLAGNVWEWSSSLYMPYPYQMDDGREDRELEGERVTRGGGWGSQATHLRCTNRGRQKADDQVFNLGFRLVRDP